MKLFDIIREMDGEEDGMKGLGRNSYDLTIQSTETQAAIDALNDIDNYGPYAQSMRDPEAIKKMFGPSIPAQKAGAAWKNWDELDEEGKENKLADIAAREPQEYEAGLKEAEKGYAAWQAEGNEGTIEEYLKTLSGKALPKMIVGKFGKNYFPLKTPANLKKYSGKMEEGVHYIVNGDEITFPQKDSPFATKAYLEKVVKTIMDNAGVKYSVLRVEPTDSPEIEKPKRSTKPDAPSLSTTLPDKGDASSLRKLLQSKFNIPSAKYEIVPTEGEEVKLVITGLTPSQRASIQAITTDYARDLMESKLRMQKLAGVITEAEYNESVHLLTIHDFSERISSGVSKIKQMLKDEGQDI